MTLFSTIKTSFTSGELDPELAGRIDIQAWEDGAAKLRNVLVRRSGGIVRRPGSRSLAQLPGAVRLISYHGKHGFELLALAPFSISVVRGHSVVQSNLAVPWSLSEIASLTWTRTDNGILVCHEDVPPQILEPDSNGTWQIRPLAFDTGSDGQTLQPYGRFSDNGMELQAVDLQTTRPASDPIPENTLVELHASSPLFEPDHLGVIFRLHGKEIVLQSVATPSLAVGLTLQQLDHGSPTRDWDEQTFSQARGWPIATTQHQDRLVFGGNRSAPDSLWLSKTGHHFNFDLGTGLDDEAIAFRLRSDTINRIRQLVSGRRLQVLADQNEWVVSGTPLTPATIQVHLQTNVGSPNDRQVHPLEIDGVTLFVGATLRELREFLYSDSEQAFQAPDIALLSRHLMRDPIDMAFDAERRIVAIVRADGELVTATIDRNANFVAWSLQSTDGDYKAVAVHDRSLLALVERHGSVYLEAFDDNLYLDNAIELESGSPSIDWSGFAQFIGKQVTIIADDLVRYDMPITSDAVVLDQPASKLVAGLSFEHVIQALPLAERAGRFRRSDPLYRPVSLSFRVFDTAHLEVDAGRGMETIIDSSGSTSARTGDVRMRAFGWRRGYSKAPWSIVQSEPKPFSLLSATTEIKVNN